MINQERLAPLRAQMEEAIRKRRHAERWGRRLVYGAFGCGCLAVITVVVLVVWVVLHFLVKYW